MLSLLEAYALCFVIDASAGAYTENEADFSLSLGSDLVFNVAYGACENVQTVKQKGCGKGETNLCKLIFESIYRAERSYLHPRLIYAGFNDLSVFVESRHTVKAVIDVNTRKDRARSARPMLCWTAVKGIVARPDGEVGVDGDQRYCSGSEFHSGKPYFCKTKVPFCFFEKELTFFSDDDKMKKKGIILSKYAFESIDEFISECVAEYVNSPMKARSTAKSVVGIILGKG